MKNASPKPPARIRVSLHPDIFYALQLLSEEGADTHTRWKAQTLERFPLERWPIRLPGVLWTAVPDVLEIEPTTEIGDLVAALEEVPDRILQLRLLTGLLHHESAAIALLDDGEPMERIAASLPRNKREWLAHVGLYPLEPEIEEALDRLIHSPHTFRSGLVATITEFWQSTFSATWAELLPALKASVEDKILLYEQCSFVEFLRHTLLPIELVPSRKALRALRGGYELPLNQIKECILTPSAFNTSRFWTTQGSDDEQSPWLPYAEPDLEPSPLSEMSRRSEPRPDVALIFRALGDATRFAMMSLIGRCPRSAAELASQLSVSKPTISHHLHLLRAAGLVHETDHKDSVLISLNKKLLYQLSELSVARLVESREPLELTRSRRT